MMVGCTPLFSDARCLWEIVIRDPKRSFRQKEINKSSYIGKEIWIGDSVFLKNKETSALLSASEMHVSQTTE